MLGSHVAISFHALMMCLLGSVPQVKSKPWDGAISVYSIVQYTLIYRGKKKKKPFQVFQLNRMHVYSEASVIAFGEACSQESITELQP